MRVAVGPRLSAAGGVAITGIDLAQPLPPAPKAQILAAFRDHHIVVFRWGVSGGSSVAAMREDPPVDHPLVRTHPDTGKKALYLGNHASHILGMPEDEGAAILEELLRHTTQRQFVYAHRWQRGDLVMWDNRCLLHRAVANYQLDKERRILHRSVVCGTKPF